MQFTFESLNQAALAQGSSYMMDFGEAKSTKQAAPVEAKLLTVFGKPFRRTMRGAVQGMVR